ncbi:hypothetical protein FOA52_013114 [Chlamydomonas sp. UWO 241]|nr:hypothetical protein FOA52_013114 [Chlamydomonas sp. UWO 241]
MSHGGGPRQPPGGGGGGGGGASASGVGSSAAAEHHGAQQQQCPLTPPHVSGVSFAPVQNYHGTGHGDHAPSASAYARPPPPAHVTGSIHPPRRPPPLRTLPAGGGAGGGAAGCGASGDPAARRAAGGGPAPDASTGPDSGGGTDGGGANGAGLEFVAQGRGLAVARVAQVISLEAEVSSSSPRSLDSPDPMTYYREIYGLRTSAESSCDTPNTPPALNIELIHRVFDANQPLGPLSPAPLSPSILTLGHGLIDFTLNGLSEMDLRPPSSYAGNTERSFDAIGDVDAGGHSGDCAVQEFGLGRSLVAGLPDMRTCESPVLRNCDTPSHLPQ